MTILIKTHSFTGMEDKKRVPEWRLDAIEVRVTMLRKGYERYEDLAKEIGMTKQGLAYMIGNGTYTRKTLSALCHHLDCTPMALLRRVDFPESNDDIN